MTEEELKDPLKQVRDNIHKITLSDSPSPNNRPQQFNLDEFKKKAEEVRKTFERESNK